MYRFKGKNTKPELLAQAMLHRMGYRFRFPISGVPETEIVILKYKTLIFIHGCVWHRNRGYIAQRCN